MVKVKADFVVIVFVVIVFVVVVFGSIPLSCQKADEAIAMWYSLSILPI